jgi:hypothetical protein
MQAEQRRLLGRLRTSQRIATTLGPVSGALAGFGLGRRLLFGEVLHRPAALAATEAREWVRAFAGCPGFGSILDGLEAMPAESLPRDPEIPAADEACSPRQQHRPRVVRPRRGK